MNMEQEILKKLEHQDKRFDELVSFLQENMATKEDLKDLRNEFEEFRVETDGNFRMLRNEFEEFRVETDGNFRMLRNEFEEFRVETDGNFRMIRNELSDIKRDLEKLEKRTIEDADAASKDILELRARVEVLEAKLQHI